MRFHPLAAEAIFLSETYLPNVKIPTCPAELLKLDTVEQALAKATRLLSFTTSHWKPCFPITGKEADIHRVAQELVNLQFQHFQVPVVPQPILSKYGYGIYCATTDAGIFKIGMSISNVSTRVKSQVTDVDLSKAICLMTPEQVQNMIPNEIVTKTINLKLPGLQFHKTHKEKLQIAIKTFWAEVLCYACTNCPIGIVGERFLEVPDERVTAAFRELSANGFNPKALKILKRLKYFHFLQTWKTMSSVLADLANAGDENLQRHLATLGRQDGYSTRHIFSRIFDVAEDEDNEDAEDEDNEAAGKNKDDAGIFFDAVEDKATVAICEQLVRDIATTIGNRNVEDLSEAEKQQIRDMIQASVGNTERGVFNTYIPPPNMRLGRAALEKFGSVFGDIREWKPKRKPHDEHRQWEHRPEEHCLLVEHCLLDAINKVKHNWTDNELIDKVDIGRGMYFCTHKKSGYTLLVVPSFFKIAAEDVSNEQRMITVEDMAHLFKYLLKADIIDEAHYKYETRMLKSYAMRLNMKDGVEGKDRSYHEARVRYHPHGYFPRALKNNLNLFAHVGRHGIPVAVGQLLVHLLGESLFNRIMTAVYGIDSPTPYSENFVCLGIDRQGCRCRTGFDPETAQVFFIGDFPEHPLYGRFLCDHCRRSNAFYTHILEKLEEIEEADLTEEQSKLLRKYRERRENRNAARRGVPSGPRTAGQIVSSRRYQDNLAHAEANRQRQAIHDAANPTGQSLRKYTKNKSVRYPGHLFRRMCMALLFYVRQHGSENLDTEMLSDVLRAVLIRYNTLYPDEEVVELYVVDNGNRPVYFQKEFEKVIKTYMVKGNAQRQPRRNGRLWIPADDNVVSENQRLAADVARLGGNYTTTPELIERVVEQTFAIANVNTFDSPVDIRPDMRQVKMRDRGRPSNGTPDPTYWVAYTQGIQLHYTDQTE